MLIQTKFDYVTYQMLKLHAATDNGQSNAWVKDRFRVTSRVRGRGGVMVRIRVMEQMYGQHNWLIAQITKLCITSECMIIKMGA